LLTIVQIKPASPSLLAERLTENGGWIQVALFSLYGGFISYKMSDRNNRARWRGRIWMLFSFVFFSQLLLGLCIDSLFLMSGKLHFPIPGLILAGPIYRFEIGFMPILLFSTILLSGPAWCSQLCYFGAFDYYASNQSGQRPKHIDWFSPKLRFTMLTLIVCAAFVLRILKIGEPQVSILSVIFGITGIGFMVLFSKKCGIMTHCTSYCPVGAVVSLTKKASPFRFELNNNCKKCMSCIKHCKYGALNSEQIKIGKIGITCTYCGDCLKGCKHNGFEYRFLNLSTKRAELLWIIITVTLHSCFMAIARI
ncbi:MAG: 4Fe-4S binding protein, partial [Bacteroidales bacterium]